MRLVLACWVAAVIATGCTIPCGDEGTRIAGIGNSPYCARREAEARQRKRQAEDVDTCVRQGGDPVACRAAVYGGNRDVSVQVGPR